MVGFNTDRYEEHAGVFAQRVVGLALLVFTILAAGLAITALRERREPVTLGAAAFDVVMLGVAPWLFLTGVRLVAGQMASRPLLPPLCLILFGTGMILGGTFVALVDLRFSHSLRVIGPLLGAVSLGLVIIGLGRRRRQEHHDRQKKV